MSILAVVVVVVVVVDTQETGGTACECLLQI